MDRRTKRGLAIRGTILAVWLGTMLWIVRYEAFPEYFTHLMPGYRALIGGDVLLKDSWMKLLLNGQPIGYSQTSIETRERDPSEYYVVTSRVRLKLVLMGVAQSVDVDTTVGLDVMQRLQSFSLDMDARDYRLRLKAVRRTADGQFLVVMNTGVSSSRRTIEIPDDVVLHSPMMEMALKSLKPGESITMRTLDPTTLTTMPILVRALRKETITVRGEPIEATVLSSEFHGVSVLSWINAEGDMLRQETPFGWTMERCTIDEAFAALHAAGRSTDTLTSMAVPCRGTIDAPRESRELLLRLTHGGLTAEELTTNRQRVMRSDDAGIELLVKAAVLPRAGAGAGASPSIPPELRPFLDPTPAIQSDAADIVRTAREITAGATGAVARAVAICQWVDTHVEDAMTVSVPSALDVLRTRKGDCNEHTYLFVALARAAGIPAAVRVGIVYQNGAFYYHAWPAVFLGDWVEMDPTFGQLTVDATHLSLVEGELPNQVSLLKVMGQLRIEILRQGAP